MKHDLNLFDKIFNGIAFQIDTYNTKVLNNLEFRNCLWFQNDYNCLSKELSIIDIIKRIACLIHQVMYLIYPRFLLMGWS